MVPIDVPIHKYFSEAQNYNPDNYYDHDYCYSYCYLGIISTLNNILTCISSSVCTAVVLI